MKFLDDEHLRELSGKRFEDIPEFVMGEKFDLEDRQDVAESIRYIALRLLNKTRVRVSRKVLFGKVDYR